MERAQKRGMGKKREWTAWPKDKNTDRHASRYSEACLRGGGVGAFWACPSADISRGRATPAEPCEPKGGREEEEKGGERRREDGGGGDKDAGTTLVIGSLATVG